MMRHRQRQALELLVSSGMLTTAQVAKALKVSKPEASRVLNRLADKGLARRGLKPDDLRVALFTPEAGAQQALDENG